MGSDGSETEQVLSFQQYCFGSGNWTWGAKRHPAMKFLLTDVSPDMIEKATARSEGLANTQCFEMDAQDMHQLEGNSIDAVVCCYGLMFPENKAKAFSEIHRTLKPGGVLITTYWKQVQTMKFSAQVIEAILGGPPPPPPINPTSLAAEGIMEKFLSDDNLNLIEMEENEYPFDLGNERNFAFSASTIPIHSLLKEQEKSGNKEAFSIARSTFDPWIDENKFLQPNGKYVIHGNVYKLAVAKKE